MQDPRAIANFVLDVAEANSSGVTNLALNKIVYFLHGLFLVKAGRPLVAAKIEAWEYGPVFREIYHEFKAHKSSAIKSRARQKDYSTGELSYFRVSLPSEELEMLRHYAALYLKIEPRKLVDMSHVEDGPWHEAWYHDGTVNPGMQISDEAIMKHFSKSVRH